MKIESGKFYWIRNKLEKSWSVVYCGEDSDSNLWLHFIGGYNLNLATMIITEYEIRECPRPVD